VYANFAELDWRPLAAAINRLEAERRALAASSDLLRTLQAQLGELVAAQALVEADYESASRAQATLAEKLREAHELRADCAQLAGAVDADVRAALFPVLAGLRQQALGEHTLTVESCDNRERDMRACTEGALTGSTDEEYTETKFLRVRRIIERFRGREAARNSTSA
jgi:uncharacterized protein YPO0396